MVGNQSFLESGSTIEWLAQFPIDEQQILVKMLSKMRLVSAGEFSQGLRELIIQRLTAPAVGSPIGLYAEREVRKHRITKAALPLFKQTTGKVRSATSTFRAIDPVLLWKPEVGSEGIIAQLITELNRTHPQCLNHPNPRQIRQKKIRRFVVVTDFIGSGQRLEHFLDAAWKTWSVRSWHSSGALRGIRFEVVCYSATEIGRKRIEAHRCRPLVSLVAPCPTISSSFDKEVADELRKVCITRDPGDRDPVAALGYEGAGALIAFAHGAPNNVPRILTDTSKRKPAHIPLFQKRVTASTRCTFSSGLDTAADIQAALIAMGAERLAKSGLIAGLPVETAKNLLVLTALRSTKKQTEVIAGKTSLTLPEVERSLGALLKLGWITSTRHVTETGQQELRERRASKPSSAVSIEPKNDYYPKQLRAPV